MTKIISTVNVIVILYCSYISICYLQHFIIKKPSVSAAKGIVSLHVSSKGVYYIIFLTIPTMFLLLTHVPLMTPSGLSMGMILKTKASLRLWATRSLLHRNSKVPFITQLALDSPGCTRLVSTI